MILAIYSLSEKGRMVHHCQTVNVIHWNIPSLSTCANTVGLCYNERCYN